MVKNKKNMIYVLIALCLLVSILISAVYVKMFNREMEFLKNVSEESISLSLFEPEKGKKSSLNTLYYGNAKIQIDYYYDGNNEVTLNVYKTSKPFMCVNTTLNSNLTVLKTSATQLNTKNVFIVFITSFILAFGICLFGLKMETTQ